MILKGVILKNNEAASGGAIMYKNQRPKIINATFMNNKAIYGVDLASYPIHLRVVNVTESDTFIIPPEFIRKPSINFPIFDTLTLAIFDFDGQLVNISIPDKYQLILFL